MSFLGKRIIKTIAIIGTIICAMFITFFCNDEENAVRAIETKDVLPFAPRDENQKVAYLTFDDGPSRNTIPLLDILDDYQIKATFFVMANSTPEGMNGYREMIKRGHAIALHTYTHDYREIYVSKEAFFQNISKLEQFLKTNFAIDTNILRFPGGSKNVSSRIYGGPTIMKQIAESCETRGYRYFDWNVDSKDGISPSVSVQAITSNVLNGSKDKKNVVILLHDINLMKNTVTALPAIIDGLKNQGFTFDVINDQTEEMRFK